MSSKNIMYYKEIDKKNHKPFFLLRAMFSTIDSYCNEII